MCQYKSAIVTRNGDIYHHALTDSHSEIEGLFKIRDTMENRTCKVEFYPDTREDMDKPEKYVLHIDGHQPDWWTDSIAEKTASKLRLVVESCIAKEDGEFLGTTVICRNKLIFAKYCKVVSLGSSTVTARDSSKVEARDSSKVEARDSSKVEARDSSKVEALDSSKVTAYDSSTVTACDSSTVTARGSSKVEARGSSKVMARDSSKVEAWDSSKVEACDSSTVMARGSSTVMACDSSTVTACDSSTVKDKRIK